MSLLSRIRNVFRADRVNGEIDAELQSHIYEAIEAGRDPEEARRAFGSMLKRREDSRDVRILPWLDSLRADAVFGWRQLVKRKVTSAAAVLSLALAIGACTGAFRLIDAMLLRPLPVANPEQLYTLSRHGIGPDGNPSEYDGFAYPAFELMREAAAGRADLMAVSYDARVDITFASDQEIEKAHLQYVSGSMFQSFGLNPAAGRLLTPDDDRKPGMHPYAVISYDYWSQRFGKDSGIVGRTFRFGETLYEIAGVIEERFTGTEPGTVTAIFIPAMMHPAVTKDDWTWHRTFVRVHSGVALEPLRATFHATSRAFEENRAKAFKGMTKASIDKLLDQVMTLDPAASGTSLLQQGYRRSLVVLGVLVALVLLIACANVANLMTAQAAARGREMALRVSIGAGRWRLVQLVLVESAWLAVLASAIGGLFAWWSAPLVIGTINPADNPVRLSLPMDWRVLGFGLALTVFVILLFGLAPALRASAVQPSSALKGGADPHSRRRLMNALIAAQVAFCFVVLFVAGLFVRTFERLSSQSTGYSSERMLALDTVASTAQTPVAWDQLAERLRALPGIEKVSLADSALLSGNYRNNFISVNGAPPNEVLTYFRYVTPGWLDTMKIGLIDGRDFEPNDASPGTAIVNESFAKIYFPGENAVGKTFRRGRPDGKMMYRIAGVVRDARYRNMRDPILSVAFVPIRALDENNAVTPIREGTLMVRTTGANQLAMSSTLRQEVARGGRGFRVTNLRTQSEINERHTVRERLLARLALFFAIVALLLAGIGLYGVLDYSVLQRRREIGIRMAIGAQASDIAGRVASEGLAMVTAGALAGIGLGFASVRYIETLLYQVKPTELATLAIPAAMILGAACVAALPAVIRAVRIDPVVMLRME